MTPSTQLPVVLPAEPRFDGPAGSEVGPPVVRDAAADADPVGNFAGVGNTSRG